VAFEGQKRWLGREIEVLVDGKKGRKTVGRSYGDAPDIDGVVYLSGKGLEAGDLVTARVTRAAGYDLHASLVPAGERA
jgi:ribosomal protein S12 methylthiotransferase